jgi:hypothetical protein
MPTMKEITCKCGCGRKKMVRQADINRGWGKFYDKSCKAREQERRTGQNRKYHLRKNALMNHDPSWDAHQLPVSAMDEDSQRREYEDDHPFSTDALGQW